MTNWNGLLPELPLSAVKEKHCGVQPIKFIEWCMKNSTHGLQHIEVYTPQFEDVMNDQGCHTIQRIRLTGNNINRNIFHSQPRNLR
jgi:hypothetical protein